MAQMFQSSWSINSFCLSLWRILAWNWLSRHWRCRSELHKPVLLRFPKLADWPVDRPAVSTDQSPAEVQPDWPRTTELHQLTDQPSTDQTSAVSQQVPCTSGLQTPQDSDMGMDSDGDPVHQLSGDFEEEGELSDPDHNLTVTETDQALSEEQTYRETVRGIRFFMGWTHISDMETSSSSADRNPFPAPKQQPLRTISVKLLTDKWLCKKMDKLNITLVEGYPSRTSEASGLQKDQFVEVSRSQSKWYGLHQVCWFCVLLEQWIF